VEWGSKSLSPDHSYHQNIYIFFQKHLSIVTNPVSSTISYIVVPFHAIRMTAFAALKSALAKPAYGDPASTQDRHRTL
jgi:hypothetical protein